MICGSPLAELALEEKQDSRRTRCFRAPTQTRLGSWSVTCLCGGSAFGRRVFLFLPSLAASCVSLWRTRQQGLIVVGDLNCWNLCCLVRAGMASSVLAGAAFRGCLSARLALIVLTLEVHSA